MVAQWLHCHVADWSASGCHRAALEILKTKAADAANAASWGTARVSWLPSGNLM